jgi:dTMP kinase
LEQFVAGVFITFEGIDGSGKSTQLRLLAQWFGARGEQALVTREPGGTPLGKKIRAALLDIDGVVDPLAELLLYAADRAQHVNTVLRPSLAAGEVVLSDRYADATVAYQGAGRQFPPQLIARVVEIATGGLKPDLTLLFDLPVAMGLARTLRRGDVEAQPDRLDSEDVAFHERVRRAYLDLAAAEPGRVRLVDAAGAAEEIQTRVRALVTDFLATRNRS